MKQMTLVYRFEESLYVNVTNKCCCACIFCVRANHDSVGECESLWLEHEPTLEEMIGAFEQQDLEQYKGIVFCGYGEPLERIDLVVPLCEYLRYKTNLPIRINTNGLADLIHGKSTVPLLSGLVDRLAISMNAPDAQTYEKVTRPRFKEGAFESMLHFASQAKSKGMEVSFSIVDILEPEQIQASKQLADKMGIPLRIRQMIE